MKGPTKFLAAICALTCLFGAAQVQAEEVPTSRDLLPLEGWQHYQLNYYREEAGQVSDPMTIHLNAYQDRILFAGALRDRDLNVVQSLEDKRIEVLPYYAKSDNETEQWALSGFYLLGFDTDHEGQIQGEIRGYQRFYFDEQLNLVEKTKGMVPGGVLPPSFPISIFYRDLMLTDVYGPTQIVTRENEAFSILEAADEEENQYYCSWDCHPDALYFNYGPALYVLDRESPSPVKLFEIDQNIFNLAVDSQDRVYLSLFSDPHVYVYNLEGELLGVSLIPGPVESNDYMIDLAICDDRLYAHYVYDPVYSGHSLPFIQRASDEVVYYDLNELS